MATKNRKLQAHERGRNGEDIAAAWYEQQGYTIIERNWRCFEGEIDLIAQRGRSLVVCEVKARGRSRIDPALALTPAKASKVRTATYRWLEQSARRGRVRFDLALVVDGQLQVMQGAF